MHSSRGAQARCAPSPLRRALPASQWARALQHPSAPVLLHARSRPQLIHHDVSLRHRLWRLYIALSSYLTNIEPVPNQERRTRTQRTEGAWASRRTTSWRRTGQRALYATHELGLREHARIALGLEHVDYRERAHEALLKRGDVHERVVTGAGRLVPTLACIVALHPHRVPLTLDRLGAGAQV
jgi:hypothetical protein